MLGYALVLLIALGAGSGVYIVAMRMGAPPPAAPGADDWRSVAGAAGERSQASAEPAYAPVAPPDSPSWHSRLNGTLGLVLAVSVAAVTLGIALYQVGHLIARLMSQAASS